MMSMAKTSAELVSNEMRINNNKSLSYDEYARILKDTKLTGVTALMSMSYPLTEPCYIIIQRIKSASRLKTVLSIVL